MVAARDRAGSRAGQPRARRRRPAHDQAPPHAAASAASRVALGAFAIIGATTSMAVASQSAIPGDALYPVKRAIENTQAGFSVGDDAKGETAPRQRLRAASTRSTS